MNLHARRALKWRTTWPGDFAYRCEDEAQRTSARRGNNLLESLVIVELMNKES
jgi:hypothetical protein